MSTISISNRVVVINARRTTRAYVQLLAGACLAILVAGTASAAIVGPYTADANTQFLFHLDESSSSGTSANAGHYSAGTNVLVNMNFTSSTAGPPITGNLGFAGLTSGTANFNNASGVFNFNGNRNALGYGARPPAQP